LTNRILTPEHIAASDFEERIQIALERGRFRVLAVRTNSAVDAALALQQRFSLELVNLDHRLTATAQSLMAQLKVQENVVHDTDVRGFQNKDWPQLCKLMQRAALILLEELKKKTAPLLIVNPGLLARYELSEFLRQLIASCRLRDDRAIFLLVPSPDQGGVPRINATLPIPDVGAPDSLVVPPTWVKTINNKAS
jgi:hypothetical protein